jgi:hypothetical protein
MIKNRANKKGNIIEKNLYTRRIETAVSFETPIIVYSIMKDRSKVPAPAGNIEKTTAMVLMHIMLKTEVKAMLTFIDSANNQGRAA